MVFDWLLDGQQARKSTQSYYIKLHMRVHENIQNPLATVRYQ